MSQAEKSPSPTNQWTLEFGKQEGRFKSKRNSRRFKQSFQNQVRPDKPIIGHELQYYLYMANKPWLDIADDSEF